LSASLTNTATQPNRDRLILSGKVKKQKKIAVLFWHPYAFEDFTEKPLFQDREKFQNWEFCIAYSIIGKNSNIGKNSRIGNLYFFAGFIFYKTGSQVYMNAKNRL